MGEASLDQNNNYLIIHSVIFFYGNAANDELSRQIAADIATHWNQANGQVMIKNKMYKVHFNIEGIWAKSLTPEMIIENTNPRNNYFRLEGFSHAEVSFVDGIGSNTGYFLVSNLLNNSTTAAHEYGHTIGLDHPDVLDIRGQGVPGIMYPRGTIVDPAFQYSPVAIPHGPGGTINPHTRKVLQVDIDNLRLPHLPFTNKGTAVLGNFSSQWHDAHLPL
jgi:hypothetical protein